jgi:hypothetical protein
MSFTFVSNESINTHALDIIIANYNDLPLSDEQKKPIKIQDKEFPLLPLLKKMRKSVSPAGLIQTTYFYSQTHCPSCPGRQFVRGGVSLQGCKKWIRHTLAQGYHDYDVVNCHPTIFVQYCDKKGWDTTPFKQYLDKRDECLKDLMDANNLNRDDAKEVILSILNGGTKAYNNLESKPLWLKVYKMAVEDIQKKMMEDPENVEVVKNVKEHKKKNIPGKVMNHILCNVENTCLMEAIDYLGIRDPVLCFDGFMSKTEIDQATLDDMAEHVYSKTGYKFKWLEKPMTEGLDLTGFSHENQPEEDEKMTDLKVYKELIEKFGDYIKKDRDEVYFFDKRTGMWSCGKNGFGICMNMLEELGHGDTHSKMRNVYSLTNKLPESTQFFEKAKENRRGHLLFSNCIRDIENGKSLPFSHKFFFNLRIDREFNEVPNEEHIEKVWKHLYEEPHESAEVRNELWKITSVAMTGRNPGRSFTNNIGQTRCGKSTYMNTYTKAFAPFVKCVSAQAFSCSKFAKANDHNDQLLALEDCRMLLASEKPGAGEIDEELIKSVTGGDSIIARGCGEKTKKEFVPEAYLQFMSNSPLVFNKKGEALKDRNKSIKWKRQFPITGDKSVEDFLKSDEAKDALYHLTERGIQQYKKEGFLQVQEITDFTEEINGEDDKFLETIEDCFVLSVDTANQDTWMLATDVYKCFKHTNLSQYEIKEKFSQHGVVNGKFRKKGEVNPRSYFKGLVKVRRVDDV